MPIRIVAKTPSEKRKARRGQFGRAGKGKMAGPPAGVAGPRAGLDPKRKIPKSFHEIIGGSERGKPHSTKEGRTAAGRRRIKRILGKDRKIVPDPRYYPDRPKKPIDPRSPYIKDRVMTPLRAKKAEGGRAGFQGGGRTRLLEELGRVEAEPSNRNRRAEISRVHGELNRGYKGGGRIGLKHGSGKTLTKTWPRMPKRKFPKDLRKRLIDTLAGGIKGKPHSSPSGQAASAGRTIKRIAESRAEKARPEGVIRPKGSRSGYAAGSIVKGAVKGGKRFLDFIKTGKHVDKHGVKTNIPKAAERLTGKPHVDHGKRKRIKHLGKGKAKGGRIGLKHGSAQSHYMQHGYGPHKIQLRSGKPKIAKKGW